MKVAIYNEPIGDGSAKGLGGSERCAAVLADYFAKTHETELVHHRRGLSCDMLSRQFGVANGAFRLRYADCCNSDRFGRSRLPWKRLRERRNWHSELSCGSDVFIALLHGTPPFCHARVGILYVHFPLKYAREQARGLSALSPSSLVKQQEWQARLRSYKAIACNSQFTQEWLRTYWGAKAEVIYPPIGNNVTSGRKDGVILSVGRFDMRKSQAEMVSTFASSIAPSCDWRYQLIGSVTDQNYLDNLRQRAEVLPVDFLVDAANDQVNSAYARSRVFWHAMGYNVPDDDPYAMEHFGMSTAEAMRAGCVPVVVNRGGQREIVQHGVSGFLWNTLEELVEYTMRLINDDVLWMRMSAAAQARSRQFSSDRFSQQINNLVELHKSR